jgi:SAM-dependent methyltransferase
VVATPGAVAVPSLGAVSSAQTTTAKGEQGREFPRPQGDEIESLTDADLEAERSSDPGLPEAPAEPVSSKKKPPPPPLKRTPSIEPAPPAPPTSAPPALSVSAAESSPSDVGASEPSRKRAKAWWEEIFSDDFLRTMLRGEKSAIGHECDFIEDRLGLEKGAVMLDLGCGAGEHAVELARRGYNVVGYDLSLAMLARAQDEAQERGQQLNFLQGDMRDMAFEDAFDGIYCWSTTFGYFDDDKNLNVLSRIRRGLRQGGMLLLDVANRDYISPRQPSSVWFEGDGCVCMDEMVVDFFASRLRVKRTVMFEDGRARECEYSIRLYALHELGKILHDAGFKVLEVTGHPAHPGVFFGAESPRIIVLAERS